MNEYIGQLISLKIAISFAILFMLWIWESWRPFFVAGKWRVWHAVQNLSIALSNTILIAVFFSSVTLMVLQWTSINNVGLLSWLEISSTAKLIMALLILDAWMYLWHRLNHVIPFFWRFHKTHHSDNKMDVTTTSRFHLVEQMISATIRLTLIPVFGFDLLHLITYDILVNINTQLQHSNISIGRWDRYLRYIIVTPDMHKIHHSRWRPETDSNYSVVFSVWDRIAFSFRMRTDINSIQFGLDEYDDRSWQSFWGMMKTPFVENKSTNKSSQHDSINEE